MSELPHPATAELQLADVLFALSDPARLHIVRELAAAEPAGSLLTCQSVATDMPKSTRSHHLKVLREAGVVRNVSRGRERILSLRRHDLAQRWPGLLDAILAADAVSA